MNVFDSFTRRAYHSPIMQYADLPRQIDLTRLGGESRNYVGGLAGEGMTKLGALVEDVTAIEATIEVAYLPDQERFAVRGDCSAQVSVLCERCLEPMRQQIDGRFDVLSVDRPQEADQLPADQAVVEAPRGQLDIATLIEDELILGLPVVPRHEDTACDGGQRHFGPDNEPLPKALSPFAALGALRSDSNGSE